MAEMSLELRLRSKDELADGRMQTIGANHQIEPALPRMFHIEQKKVGLLRNIDHFAPSRCSSRSSPWC